MFSHLNFFLKGFQGQGGSYDQTSNTEESKHIAFALFSLIYDFPFLAFVFKSTLSHLQTAKALDVNEAFREAFWVLLFWCLAQPVWFDICTEFIMLITK